MAPCRGRRRSSQPGELDTIAYFPVLKVFYSPKTNSIPKREYPSGQRGSTQDRFAQAFAGSTPASRTLVFPDSAKINPIPPRAETFSEPALVSLPEKIAEHDAVRPQPSTEVRRADMRDPAWLGSCRNAGLHRLPDQLLSQTVDHDLIDRMDPVRNL